MPSRPKTVVKNGNWMMGYTARQEIENDAFRYSIPRRRPVLVTRLNRVLRGKATGDFDQRIMEM